MTVPLASVLAGTRLRAAATGVLSGYGINLFGGDDSGVPILSDLNNAMMLLFALIAVVLVWQLMEGFE